ncbi:PTH2-domain-containing protein [Pluteus cervinus]|uniref:PTH2-domain-containing protein n=1 Tax=Pluteus cervinus TaxID=181527 RepID=A0ACD3BFG1_9AGAR|nr:PTH2-domain-containing protein [Pluteus cervinus]
MLFGICRSVPSSTHDFRFNFSEYVPTKPSAGFEVYLSHLATTALFLSATSLAVGYYFGYSSRQASAPQQSRPEPAARDEGPQPVQEASEDEDSDDEEGIPDGDLGSIKAGTFEPCKLVLVVRTDLNMTPGKIAAQHATLACYKALVKNNPSLVKHWERTGQAKIALKATSEEQLLELMAVAKSLNLCARTIQDAGRTQVASGSRTVLGIGPAPVELINEVTGALRLL